MKKETYFDRRLKELKEIYSENDVIKILNKKISELEIEIGTLVSEKDELLYLVQKNKPQKSEDNLENKHSEYIKLEKEVKRLCNLELRFFETFKELVIQKRENKLLQKELDEKKEEILDMISKKY